MRTMILIFLITIMVGCTSYDYEGKNLRTYIENPKYLLKDPHFEDYKKERDALESSYLSKEIEYPEYKKQLESLDKKYDNEVKKRDDIIRDY